MASRSRTQFLTVVAAHHQRGSDTSAAWIDRSRYPDSCHGDGGTRIDRGDLVPLLRGRRRQDFSTGCGQGNSAVGLGIPGLLYILIDGGNGNDTIIAGRIRITRVSVIAGCGKD